MARRNPSFRDIEKPAGENLQTKKNRDIRKPTRKKFESIIGDIEKRTTRNCSRNRE